MFSPISSIILDFAKLSKTTVMRTGRTAGILAAAAALAVSLGAAHSAGAARPSSGGFTFRMVRTPGVTCLPKGTGFDLFVIQTPNKPFGVAWYQTDVKTDSHGDGTATVRGIFNVETFTVDVDSAHAVAPTHQYHLGLWFNSPAKPFNLGCEKGAGATVPIVTPFNGAQHAGIQILNTSNFAVNRGPLAHVKA